MLRIYLGIFMALFLAFDGLPAQGADTAPVAINQLDQNGLKTGLWVITGEMVNSTKYQPHQKIEEGHYKASKREGLWKKYHVNGNLKSEITYLDNRPHGSYKLYYPDGVKEEDGNWVNQRNTGNFKRFHPNGTVSQEFIFEDNGLRTGTQKYYYENGNLEMEVEIVKGVEEGTMKRYYPNGDLMEIKQFNNGVVKKGSVQKIPPREDATPEEIMRTPAVPAKKSVRNTEDKPNLAVFKFNGTNTLYNKNKQVTQIGEFQDGRLWNGKWKKYNRNGIIEKIEVYKNGEYIGNAPITDDDL